MFEKARIHLTLWYLLIIMAISIAFSGFIYYGASQELDRALRMQKFRTEHPEIRLQIIQRNILHFAPAPPDEVPDTDVIQETKTRIIYGLVGTNFIIFLISTIAGYFLAGLTLRPIKEMVDEQNRFITDASHELNTPLTALRSVLEVNLRSKKLTLQKAREVLASNLEEVEHLQLLSAELIGLTKYQQNTAPTLTKIPLQQSIAQAIKKVMPLAKKKSIAIHQKQFSVHVNGDPRSLIELFVIVLDNAIKYSPHKSEIFISTKIQGDKVEVSIKDKGIGIAKEDMAHVFDRFYRGDKSRSKQDATGYGLGLSIAKRIVDLHGGSIFLSSTSGKGTEVVISLHVV